MDSFDPRLLRQPTSKTLLFIARAEKAPIRFTDKLGERSITADFIHDKLIAWKSGKYWVFIWEERVHDKKEENGRRLYRNHFMYRYYLVPAGKKIFVEKSQHQYDFGLHRVQKSLLQEGAIHFLTIINEDISGYILTEASED